MPTNSYFRTFDAKNEQELLHSLVTESVKIYGHDVSYIPRTLVNTDTILVKILFQNIKMHIRLKCISNLLMDLRGKVI